MKPRVFVSAVTSELQESRQLVARVLERLGYEPVRQEVFGTESGDLRQMLRESIDDCEGLIQLVGYAYGAEPPTIENEFEGDGFTRVSYTQFEFLYARSRNKRTWLIYLDESYELARAMSELDLPRDVNQTAPLAYQAERRALQQQYRDHWNSDGHIRHTANTVIELELKIERLKDEFAQLRKDFRRWQGSVNRNLAILALATLVVGLGIWRTVALQTREVRRLVDKSDESSTKPKAEIVWDVTIAPLFDNSAQIPSGLFTIPESMHVEYEQAEIDGTKAIVCRLPYRELLDKGERVRGVNFGSNIFAWHYPNLAIKVLNNSDETAMITDAIIHVDRVEVDDRPLIVIQDQSFNRIQFRNLGWGNVASPTVQFSLGLTDQLPKSGSDYTFQATPALTFDGDMYVPLPRDLASPLADAAELQATGEFIYGPEDQRTCIAFTTRVTQQIVSGRPVSPSFQYSVKLESQRRTDSPIHVSMSQSVESQGGTDQFLLRVASDRSARYWLTVDLHSAGKKSLGTHRFILDVFVPQIESKETQAP